MSESALPDDPWEMPPVPLDPELIATSQRLMSKSEPILDPAESSPTPEVDARDLQIRQLEQQQQWLFHRNATLTAELAQLRITNQCLVEKLAQLRQPPQATAGWFSRWWQGLRRS